MVGGVEGGAAVPVFASAETLTPSASLGVQAAKCFPHIGALPGSEVEQRAMGPLGPGGNADLMERTSSWSQPQGHQETGRAQFFLLPDTRP